MIFIPMSGVLNTGQPQTAAANCTIRRRCARQRRGIIAPGGAENDTARPADP